MKLFRNREIKIAFFASVCVAFAVCILTRIYCGGLATLFCGIVAVSLLAIFLITENVKYNKLSQLSDNIDLVLNGDFAVNYSDLSEGELSILECEISKVITMLKKQTLSLENDKVFLSDSLADISHQLKTPLTSLNLIVAKLRKPDIPRDEYFKLLRDVYSLLGRMEWQITTLLKISKIDAKTAFFKKEEMPVSKLIKTASQDLEIPLEIRDITLEIQGEEKANVLCDLMWTSEALSNIIKNCMEHTPHGGKITVNYSENAIYTEITITDTGHGISKEDMPHLFERFYRSKDNENSSGVGIGLALYSMIIKSHNGTIKAENNPQTGGALFIIRFYKSSV